MKTLHDYKETINDLKSQTYQTMRDEKKVTFLIESHNGICWYISDDITFYNTRAAFNFIISFDFDGQNIYIK